MTCVQFWSCCSLVAGRSVEPYRSRTGTRQDKGYYFQILQLHLHSNQILDQNLLLICTPDWITSSGTSRQNPLRYRTCRCQQRFSGSPTATSLRWTINVHLLAHVCYYIYQDLCQSVHDGNDGLEPSRRCCTVKYLNSRHLGTKSIV